MGHEDTVLSQFIAIALLCIGAYSYMQARLSGKKYNLDKIELFTMHDIEPEPVVSIKATTATATKPKKKKKDGYSDFQKDCLDALKSLGLKSKKEREYILHTIFNENNPQTIQEFITIAAGKMV